MMYSSTPPIPPPKPINTAAADSSRISTPAQPSPRPPPPLPIDASSSLPEAAYQITSSSSSAAQPPPHLPVGIQPTIPSAAEPDDPGPHWLPAYLRDKSKQDLSAVLSSPALLSALTHSPAAAPPALQSSRAALLAALDDNLRLAAHLRDEAEPRLAARRAACSARLLAARQLEQRAWRAKQADMDAALAPFAPASLYQRLAAGWQEQGMVCEAMEESFLEHHHHHRHGGKDGEEGGHHTAVASEREVAEWVRRYREAKKLYYLRQERKERWDEGRVGGWR